MREYDPVQNGEEELEAAEQAVKEQDLNVEEQEEPSPTTHAIQPPDDRGATRHKAMINELYKVFDFLNKYVFNNEIGKPVISLQSKKTGPKQACWCSYQQVWQNIEDEQPLYFEICYHSQLIDRPIPDLATDMLHQMIHIWNAQKGLKDNCRNGTYHNGQFKVTAEQYGLECSEGSSKKNGYSEITPPAELLESLLKTIDEKAFCIMRQEIVPPKQPKEQKKKKHTPIDDFNERLQEAVAMQFGGDFEFITPSDIAKAAAELSRIIATEQFAFLHDAGEESESAKSISAICEEVDSLCSELNAEQDSEQQETGRTSHHLAKASQNDALAAAMLQMGIRKVSCQTCGATAYTEGHPILCSTCMEPMQECEQNTEEQLEE